jgi:hypothetical protein
MSEAAPLSVESALQTLAASMRHEDALRSRTEGLTWMVWAMAIVPMVLAWPAATAVAGDAPPWALLVLIPPWFVLGGVASYVLWRTAALADPGLHQRRQAGLRVVLGYAGLSVLVALAGAGLAALGWLPYTHPDAIAMCYAGIVWMVTGLWNPFGLSAQGRRISRLVGAITFLAALLAMAALPAVPRATADVAAPLLALATLCGLPFAAGAWQALRG